MKACFVKLKARSAIDAYSTKERQSLKVLFQLYRSLDLEETVSAIENADGAVEMDTHSFVAHSDEEYRANGKV